VPREVCLFWSKASDMDSEGHGKRGNLVLTQNRILLISQSGKLVKAISLKDITFIDATTMSMFFSGGVPCLLIYYTVTKRTRTTKTKSYTLCIWNTHLRDIWLHYIKDLSVCDFFLIFFNFLSPTYNFHRLLGK
jgi:hypothetical protein